MADMYAKRGGGFNSMSAQKEISFTDELKSALNVLKKNMQRYIIIRFCKVKTFDTILIIIIVFKKNSR